MKPVPEAHGLGPHVVGQRVVVRRLLRGQTGPSGGPAMTDVLGVCTSWGDGVCTVQPEAGPPVEIPIADIVSGKPVPPRPSIRHRVPPRDAQLRALALWPDLRTEPVGDWLLRASESESARRANSVLAFGPSGVEDAHARVVEFYESLGRRPIAAVLPDSAEDAHFRGRGWVPESTDADTLFQLAGLAQVRRALGQPSTEVVSLSERSGALSGTRPAVVEARIGDVARGVAAVDGDWFGFRGLEVDPARRRQGLARSLLAAMLEWGAEQGATTAYLQVLGDNEPALRLYAQLGFRTHHAYRYLAAP